MAIRRFFFLCFLLIRLVETAAQCSSGINTFPYNESFEINDGGWTSGGVGNDWAWGTPAKPVISAAGGGSKCWIVGGLTGSSYTNSEASWLQSPCFDFTNLISPYIEFKIFWESEQRFDGASFQYSTDKGNTWQTLGSSANTVNCYNENWYNNSSITYLSPLTSNKMGWSGNIQTSSGSCAGGAGSGKWLTAKQAMGFLEGNPNVIFRFIFGAGSICNNYDGFAIDDILIKQAPSYYASFTYACNVDGIVSFTNTSDSCVTIQDWDFGDPASGLSNASNIPRPTHKYPAPGKYTVKLNASFPGSSISTAVQTITIPDIKVTQLNPAGCQTNSGGSIIANVSGINNPVNYTWNTIPPQITPIASGLSVGLYTVTITGTDICPTKATGEVVSDFSCPGIFFPSGFTPNNDGKNDGFGPLGSLSTISNFQLSIYNRWGERVYFSNNPLEKWNGMVKGIKTDGNVFVWFAEYSIQGKPKEVKKGTLVLVR
jgi:gliding motility-associated-like protein